MGLKASADASNRSFRGSNWYLNEHKLGESFTPQLLNVFCGDCTMAEIAVSSARGANKGTTTGSFQRVV